MRSWANNPRYQRSMQKIAALRPEHRAILQTVTADPQFADERMRKSIQSMITKTGNVNRERNFGLTKRITEGRNAMNRRNLSYNKGQNKHALALGVANLGLSTVGGIKQRKRDQEILDDIRDRKKRYQQIDTDRALTNAPDEPWW